MFSIRTARLILRDYQPDDFENFYSPMLDPGSAWFYSDRDLDRGFMEAIFQKVLAGTRQAERTVYQLAVCLPDGTYMGSCGVRMEDIENQQASYGCALLPAYWKQGYAYEASRRLFELGFERLPIHRLSAETNCENQNARRLAERLGMKLEGELRECRHFRGRWWSTCIYAILKGEWQELRV